MSYIRWGLLGIALVWGALNLIGLARRRETPASRQASLLAVANGFGIALALAFLGAGRMLPAALCGAVGLVSGARWFVIVYRQSLHNTTM